MKEKALVLSKISTWLWIRNADVCIASILLIVPCVPAARTPRSRFARRTPLRYLEDDERALWQQQRDDEEAAIHVSHCCGQLEIIMDGAQEADQTCMLFAVIQGSRESHAWTRM